MQIREKLIFQHVGDTWIAVPADESESGFNGMLTLNDVGHDIVEMLTTDTTTEQIVDHLLEDYDADRPTVQKCVEQTIEQLAQVKLLSRCTK